MKIFWKTGHVFIWDESELVRGGKKTSHVELLYLESMCKQFRLPYIAAVIRVWFGMGGARHGEPSEL